MESLTTHYTHAAPSPHGHTTPHHTTPHYTTLHLHYVTLQVMSTLGYCLLPIVIVSVLGIVFSLTGIIGNFIGAGAVSKFHPHPAIYNAIASSPRSSASTPAHLNSLSQPFVLNLCV